ncbi:MAG: dihydroorotase [Cycloclasticus sp. symbiont of Bathymodiolus heckerae]|nr:MAG: dihydroorotase [Cycloclasticus sp. symbiont of Bathymodiolus heckerae]
MKVLIKNGRVIDPANELDGVQNICIADGKIQHVGDAPQGFSADVTIDASDKLVMPGFVDLNASLREPGFEHKATIESETKAAVTAGYTSVCCLPDTKPILDTSSVVQLILDKADAAGYAKVLPLGALTVMLEGKTLSEMYALKQSGCVAVSQAPNNNINNQVLRRALQYASTYNILVVLKPEDVVIKDDGSIHDGAISSKLGLSGIPVSAETVAIAQIIELAEETGARVHLTGVSSARAVTMIARAQFTNKGISADVHAHQLHLTELDVGTFDSNYHTSPPLRTVEDRDALIAGVVKGVFSVSSGHQPHENEAKQAPFPSTETGISSIETVLPLMLKLVADGLMDLTGLVKCLAYGPSQILDLDVGNLSAGSVADVCIVDPQEQWLVSEESLLSRGKNTPYLGHQMTGKVTHTLVNGRVVFGK